MVGDMRKYLGLVALFAALNVGEAAAQGCGPSNPNCVIPAVNIRNPFSFVSFAPKSSDFPAGPSMFYVAGSNNLVTSSGASGIEWNNAANSAVLMDLRNTGLFALGQNTQNFGRTSLADISTVGSRFLSILAASQARGLEINDGDELIPGQAVTTVAPTAHISRYEELNNISDTSSKNAALLVETLANSLSLHGGEMPGFQTSSAQGFSAVAKQIGEGDVDAINGSATQAYTGTTKIFSSYAGYFAAAAGDIATPGASTTVGAVAVGATTGNNTGRDQTYASFRDPMGFDPAMGHYKGVGTFGIQLGPGGGNINTVGIWFQDSAAPNSYDYGIVIEPGSIITAAFQSPGFLIDALGNMAATRVQMAAGSLASVTCNAGLEGTMRVITDSSTTTWGANIAAGANHVLAYCNGTNWTVAAK